MGRSVSQTSSVGNFILGRSAFKTEDPPHSAEPHCETYRGHVEGRDITIINAAHLCVPQLSQEELNQRVEECVLLSAPGPHAFLLAVQSYSFTENDKEQLKYLLDSFSDEAIKYSIVMDTDSKPDEANDAFQSLVTLCVFEKPFTFQQLLADRVESVNRLFRWMDQKVQMNGGVHLTCEVFTDVPEEPNIHSEQRVEKKRSLKKFDIMKSIRQHSKLIFFFFTVLPFYLQMFNSMYSFIKIHERYYYNKMD